MTEILQADELMHFGVKGMKWGVRKKYGYSKEYQARKDAKANLRSAKKTGTQQDIRKARNEYKKAKRTYKQSIDNKQLKATARQSLADQTLFGGVGNRAGKLSAKYNMSIDDAVKKAQRERNVSMAVQLGAGLTAMYGGLIKNMAYSSILKAAKNAQAKRAAQAAAEAITKIGSKPIIDVAGTVLSETRRRF